MTLSSTPILRTKHHPANLALPCFDCTSPPYQPRLSFASLLASCLAAVLSASIPSLSTAQRISLWLVRLLAHGLACPSPCTPLRESTSSPGYPPPALRIRLVILGTEHPPPPSGPSSSSYTVRSRFGASASSPARVPSRTRSGASASSLARPPPQTRPGASASSPVRSPPRTLYRVRLQPGASAFSPGACESAYTVWRDILQTSTSICSFTLRRVCLQPGTSACLITVWYICLQPGARSPPARCVYL